MPVLPKMKQTFAWLQKGVVTLIVGGLVACGGSKKLPDGAPEEIGLIKLLELQEAAIPTFEKLRISGRGTYTAEGRSQNFKFDLRLLKDSLIWVSLKDPILGLTIAKGQLTAQSASYYNSLEQKYFKGSPAALAERFQFNFNFEWLHHLLSAQLVPAQDSWQLSYLPGLYRLQDFDASGESAPNPTREVFTEVLLNPETFTPHRQTLSEPVNGRVYRVAYADYSGPEEAEQFPRKITLEYLHNGTTKIDLEINRLERDAAFQFPFKIPASYAPLP